MKIKAKIIISVIAAFAIVSCSSYNKVLKSGDVNLMYRTAMEYYKEKKDEKAFNLFSVVNPYFKGTEKEDSIRFYMGVSCFRMGDFYSSGEIFSDFKRDFPRNEFIEEAEYLLGMGYYYSSPPANRDQTKTRMAILSFSEFVARYPNSIKRDECLGHIEELTQKLYDKDLLNSKVYYNLDYYKAAIHAFKVSLADFPQTTHREELLYLIAKSNYLYAENSIPAMQRRRYIDMMDAYYNLISEFPETQYRKEADKMFETSKAKSRKLASGEIIELTDDGPELIENE